MVESTGDWAQVIGGLFAALVVAAILGWWEKHRRK
jgi:hypothetical protein